MTAEEYLTFERNSPEKHEFYRGEIFLMAGAKEKHNLIVANLVSSIHQIFKSKPCVVYPSDMRVLIDSKNHYVYPDVTIVCGERIFLDSEKDTLTNPTILFEVLSESTERYDRGKKFEAYRTIPSLKEFVLVSSDRRKVEIYTRNSSKNWELTESKEGEPLIFSSVELTLLLEEVYEKVEFDGEEFI